VVTRCTCTRSGG